MQIIKYIISGVINTAIGYCTFLFCLNQLNFKAEYANTAGYAVALIAAFFLNKVFVFNDTTFRSGMIFKFIIAFVIAFLTNQAILLIGIHLVNLKAETAQIFAMCTYTIIFYVLNKKYVFNTLPDSNSLP
ncbi:GtrA family protein [Pseudomonas sp. YeP6b]|uniref:GtrA family protein n=1 Tax=Pseudomonas sp. YeP6b TaxID=2861775 RepID=UPI0022008B3C|nr:GtrA family protein [Pseudomonas sp. YeP6b]